MPLRTLLVWTVLGATLAAPASALAKPKLAVLGIESVDTSTDASQEKTALLAKWLTEALRQRAAKARARYEVAPNSNRELSEVKLLQDCMDEGRDCMAAIGRDLGADKLMYGRIERRRDGYNVSLRLLNVSTRGYEKQKSDTIPASAGDLEGMQRVASELFTDLTGVVVDGAVVIDTNVPTGTVLIEGEPRGVIANRTATLRGLSEGLVTISVESPGYRRWDGLAEVKAGKVQRITVTLEPEAEGGGGPEIVGPADEEPTSKKTYRTLAWTSAVITAGGITAFTITGLKVWSLEDEKLSEIRKSWDNPEENRRITSVEDACSEAAQDGYAPVNDVCRKGKDMAMWTNILLGASATMAIATGYFAYKGYFADDKEAQPAPGSSAARRRKPKRTVLVAPTFYPEGAGVGAVIQF